MYRVAVVEDEEEYRVYLRKCLDRFGKENDVPMTVTEYANGLDIAEEFQSSFDLIFLDIEMPLMNGLRAAEKIREHDSQVLLIFITNLAQYAIKGYEVQAFDYILKPVDYAMFSLKMKRVLEVLRTKREYSVVLRNYDQVDRIPVSQIYYIETQRHYVYYHTVNGTYSQKGTMKETKEELEPYGFCIVNSGCIVNLQYVSRIRDDCVWIQNDSIPISRAKKKVFLETLTDYFASSR